MRRRGSLVVVFALVSVLGAAAQAFTVSYLDGTVELQTTKGWTALSIGDSVASDATIRISQQGSLELSRAKTKITLLKDGVYAVADLAKASVASGSGVGNSIAQKLKTLVTEKPNASAAGGVRGAEQGSDNVTWVDESDDTREQAQSLLDNKKYLEAAKLLSDAIKNASSGTDTAELGYLLGVAYYDAGQTAKAYRALGQVSADPSETWYARFVILRAQVLVDTQNYAEALTLLKPFIATYPTGEATQVAWLLSGISHRGLGDSASATTDFDTGFQLDPSSDTAKLIDQQRRMEAPRP